MIDVAVQRLCLEGCLHELALHSMFFKVLDNQASLKELTHHVFPACLRREHFVLI